MKKIAKAPGKLQGNWGSVETVKKYGLSAEKNRDFQLKPPPSKSWVHRRLPKVSEKYPKVLFNITYIVMPLSPRIIQNYPQFTGQSQELSHKIEARISAGLLGYCSPQFKYQSFYLEDTAHWANCFTHLVLSLSACKIGRFISNMWIL